MKTIFSTVLLLLALCLFNSAAAQVYVVVANTNPVRTLSMKDVQALYMGRNRAFASGDFALVFDLPRDNPVRDEFYRNVTGMTAAQVNSYWSRLIFTGQVMPPQVVPNEQIMVDQVRRNPSAIGYLSKEPSDASLKTVMVVRPGRQD